MVLYTRDTTDPVVLVARLNVLREIRTNLHRHGQTTEMVNNAIECLEDLLGEHLPSLPAERLL